MYRPLPNRFKDYISTPKPNMYQSLHTTTVIGRGGTSHPGSDPYLGEDATPPNPGIAAHWKYKQSASLTRGRLAGAAALLDPPDAGKSKRRAATRRTCTELLSPTLPLEEVFVFTPKGEVINLPPGSTVIDFAYVIAQRRRQSDGRRKG